MATDDGDDDVDNIDADDAAEDDDVDEQLLENFCFFSAWALWAYVLRDADSPVPGHEFYGQVDP